MWEALMPRGSQPRRPRASTPHGGGQSGRQSVTNRLARFAGREPPCGGPRQPARTTPPGPSWGEFFVTGVLDTELQLRARLRGRHARHDRADAEAQLLVLSDRVHEVWSGIALREDGEERTAVACTKVRFRALDRAVLGWYLDSGEWEGRAGGYAIQGRGAALVAELDGDYLNVVGLPVPALVRMAPALVFAGV